jgi:hypothetical protein
MKVVKIFSLVFILVFLVVGCKPDLVVKNLNVTWDAANKKAKAEIANIGNKDAGSFMVYFNGVEDPVSPNHRPQVRNNIPTLAKGNSIILEADFAPLAHPDNNNLGNVYKILVLVDPKNTVEESNENNNEKEVPIPATDCVDFEQQVLGTVYHVGNIFTESGVEINIQSFDWGGGQWFTGGSAKIENRQHAGHTGQDINVNNVNLSFNFGGPRESLSLHFGEYGGNLNININGDFRNFQNFADINGATIGGVTISIVNGFGNDRGFLQLSGTINSFAIVGQELWIDHVCP